MAGHWFTHTFYPGRTGHGYTEEPDSIARQLEASGSHVLHHRTGLWYERRRNDHERNMQADSEVWAPFNEYPYSRSGTGEAQDRLSKYDLNKFNPWYWYRLKQFVDLADKKNLLLWHDHYNQHNIIEEGAHWCDYPWRSANNINNLGFPEKTLFAGDKRVYILNNFMTSPVRLSENIISCLSDKALIRSTTTMESYTASEWNIPVRYIS